MEKIVLMFIPALICGMMFTSCGSDKEELTGKSTKLSPPSWVQGIWELHPANPPFSYKFTSSDIIKIEGGVEFSFNENYKNNQQEKVVYSLKETKKTNAIYEITITVEDEEFGTSTSFYSFKKGDGTYILTALGVGEIVSPDVKFVKK
jgi:hypothetical protein